MISLTTQLLLCHHAKVQCGCSGSSLHTGGAQHLQGGLSRLLAMAVESASYQPELEEAEEAPANAMRKFYAYCPCGDVCSKGNRTLGGFWSEEAARNCIYTHLTHSTYHKMSDDEATEKTDNAEVIEHAWEEGEEEDFTINRGTTRPKHRARPTEPAGEPPQRRRRRHDPADASSSAAGSQLAVTKQLQDGIAVQTRNAMSFVRAMTRAEKALRLAETVSRRAMETFQDMVASKGGCTCCGMTACGSTAKGFLDFI